MSFIDTPGFPVGTLVQWNPESRQVSNEFTIYSNEEVFIGRDKKRCQYIIEDPFISNRHLRIYTIIFDHDNPEDVAPLVYAQDISMNGTTWNDYPMGKGSSSFLLSGGDMLRLSPTSYLMFRTRRFMEEDSFDSVQQIEMGAFENQYIITERKLGSGAYGMVYMAYKKDTGEQLACKIIDIRNSKNQAIDELEGERSKFFKGTMCGSSTKPTGVIAARKRSEHLAGQVKEKLNSYNREAMILEHLSHPNIISVEKVIKSSNTIYLFQELVTAGDLFSFIQYKGGRLDDIEAAVIVRQILKALDYLHEKNIVHRDLKPDNILMTSLVDGGRVVLTDFGCARLVQPAVGRMSTMVGTLEYSAPEVLRSKYRSYTKAVDLWSLGCVAFALLAGDAPFKESNSPNPGESAKKCDVKSIEEELDRNGAGKRPKDFVRRLLILDENKRMNVKQALRHSWFTNPAHKREFEALYKRSIRNWKPRVHKEPVIVDLCSFFGSSTDTDPSEQSQFMKHDSSLKSSGGRYIEDVSHSLDEDLNTSPSRSSSLLSNWGPHRRREVLSPTLSDLALPGYSKTICAEQHQSQPPQAASNMTERLSLVQLTPSPTSSMDDIQYTSPRFSERDKESVYPSHLSKKLPVDWPRPRPVVAGIGMDRQDNHPNRMMTNGIWGGFEGEVYEEMNNMVTGESQRLVYGANSLLRMRAERGLS